MPRPDDWKEVFVCLYGVWINGYHFDYGRWYVSGSTISRRVLRHDGPTSFYLEEYRCPL